MRLAVSPHSGGYGFASVYNLLDYLIINIASTTESGAEVEGKQKSGRRERGCEGE